jgi:hypothetical protein
MISCYYGGYQTTVDLESDGQYDVKVINEDGYASGYVKAVNNKPDRFIIP